VVLRGLRAVRQHQGYLVLEEDFCQTAGDAIALLRLLLLNSSLSVDEMMPPGLRL